ncbi:MULTISPECIES: hypothetical protein [unclassified Curtobacterium]|uniref:hypothetical protein n=1 Tax=unclassified Curtobacterium TaxID=257496 RepID=UPI000824F490|nr:MULTISPECIES: hypothetical protein [unclassified Curtobacterium]WIB01240.1 hypothetical protein QOL15_06015 [Curtobacterium sp. MCBA15_012]
MRNRIIVLGVVALIAVWLGSRSNRPVVKKTSTAETLRMAWNDPHARKQRAKLRKKVAKAAQGH